MGTAERILADMEAKNRAIADIARDILDDEDWTRRVVVAAIVAQDMMGREKPAWSFLGDALTAPAKVAQS